MIKHFLGDLTMCFFSFLFRARASSYWREQGNNNDDFVPTLSRSFHQGLVDKARQMNYGKDYDDDMYDLPPHTQNKSIL
jgi:hypothetical protein